MIFKIFKGFSESAAIAVKKFVFVYSPLWIVLGSIYLYKYNFCGN